VEQEFVTGSLALDLVATVAERTTTCLEKLPDPAALADWVALAALLDGPPAVSRAGLDHARALREALYGLVSAVIDGRPPAVVDLAVVNDEAYAAPPVPQADPDGVVHLAGNLRAALSAVARSGLELLVPGDGVLRWCAGERCTRAFVDRSRGHRRRWCGMAGCGDRAKAAAYRERRRRGAPPA
jgi:predicted RNA-binding Zn ribbon-like protein